MKQYVYVMRSGTGLCKVGVTKDIEKRRAVLERGSGFAVVVVHIFGPFNSAKRLEASAHQSLAQHRRSGEWFDCPAEHAVQAIAGLLKAFVDKPDPTAEELAKQQEALDGLIAAMLPRIPGVDMRQFVANASTRARH